jgi:S-adenosyl methyltransferase
MTEEWAPPGVDVRKPSIARVYDAFLDGKDNYAVDRAVAEAALKITPDAKLTALSNRSYLCRVVQWMVAEAGIRQFIDIGSGLPTQGNVHEVAQRVDPTVRVVYVDIDPIVLAHGRALLARDHTTTVIQGDIRQPREILEDDAVTELLDLTRPVGLLMFGILHHINDDEDPAGLVATFQEAVVPGSHIALSHFCNPGEAHPEAAEQAVAAEQLFNQNFGTGRWRFHDQIRAFFGGWEIVEPGLVPLPEWRPMPDPDPVQPDNILYQQVVGGVARKL